MILILIFSPLSLITLSIIILGCGTGFSESGSNCQGMHGKCNGFECAVPGESGNWAFMGTVRKKQVEDEPNHTISLKRQAKHGLFEPPKTAVAIKRLDGLFPKLFKCL